MDTPDGIEEQYFSTNAASVKKEAKLILTDTACEQECYNFELDSRPSVYISYVNVEGHGAADETIPNCKKYAPDKEAEMKCRNFHKRITELFSDSELF
jgi:hypothetical protein